MACRLVKQAQKQSQLHLLPRRSALRKYSCPTDLLNILPSSECETGSHADISYQRARAKGGGRRLAFRVARCWTPLWVRVEWLRLGRDRARRGPVGFRMGQKIDRGPIRDSRVIRQSSSGPVGPYRVPTGFHRNPVLAPQDPTRRSNDPYWCTMMYGPYGNP